jgi:hypothetical protein
MHLPDDTRMALGHLVSGYEGLESAISLVLYPHICDG